MGHIAWGVIGKMLVTDELQVRRDRRRSKPNTGERPAYCANCGSALTLDVYGADGSDDTEWELNFFPDCDAPMAPQAENVAGRRKKNCPDCRAPNDPDEDGCTSCQAEL